MAYTTATRVGSEFKNLTFSASTFPTSTVVGDFISEADAYIDGVLSKKYEVPITGANSLLIVRNISTWLVASRVAQIMKVKTGADVLNQEGRSADLKVLAEDWLTKIASGIIQLTDATLATSHDGWKAESVDDSTVGTYEFEKGTDQW